MGAHLVRHDALRRRAAAVNVLIHSIKAFLQLLSCKAHLVRHDALHRRAAAVNVLIHSIKASLQLLSRKAHLVRHDALHRRAVGAEDPVYPLPRHVEGVLNLVCVCE